MNNIHQKLLKAIHGLETSEEIQAFQKVKGKELHEQGDVQLLAQSPEKFDFIVTDGDEGNEVSIIAEDGQFYPVVNGAKTGWEFQSVACIYQLEDELRYLDKVDLSAGKKYTREGMMRRVIDERREKAANASYTIEFASNIYGEHTLTNERGVKYKITLRDFENETGYINSIDLRTNKLGTTKHIIFAFNILKTNKKLYEKLDKTYPFIEIYLDPLHDYNISWYYPHELRPEDEQLIHQYFGNSRHYPGYIPKFLNFIGQVKDNSRFKVRPEVTELVENELEKQSLEKIAKVSEINWGLVKANLFPYQKEGVQFTTFKKGAIIADEMGLGKTLQAITTAMAKKDIFGFQKTLIVCPASLKHQWKKEIEKFTDEQATLIEGTVEQRKFIYRNTEDFFIIANYETILRDISILRHTEFDFIILDEAQKIKNYETKTSRAVKMLRRKHALIITGTPIENKLIDLYSVVAFVDPYFLAPLWEFSYQHCIFDMKQRNKIIGYYNLTSLKERLSEILIRREKRSVLQQLPNVNQHDVPVHLTEEQGVMHGNMARQLAQILRKKFFTTFDMQRIMLLLTNMRMVCDCTYLVDKETFISPKLEELRNILVDKMDLRNSDRKVIIFSEWVAMNKIIGRMLREEGIGFAELNGQIPVKNRGQLISRFETNPGTKVFLSTEAGGAGLNLQIADTVINFELPWNPAKKNQRIGRIDRLGQKSDHLTVVNFITKNSIEEKIAAGLSLKQDLFQGVLNGDSQIDMVDFSEKGKAQFLKQLQEAISGFATELTEPLIEEKTEDEKPVEEVEPAVEPEQLELFKDEFDTEKAPVEQPDINGKQSETKTKKPISSGIRETQQTQNKELQEVLNHGLGFLSGLYKMSTGKELSTEDQKVEVNEETGEVVLRFKMPGR